MSFESLLSSECELLWRTRGPEDEHGQSVDTWVSGGTVACSVQIAKSMGYRRQERANPRGEHPMAVEYEFYFAYGTLLSERDRILFDGHTIEVDLLLMDASGKQHHLEGQGHEVRPG